MTARLPPSGNPLGFVEEAVGPKVSGTPRELVWALLVGGAPSGSCREKRYLWVPARADAAVLGFQRLQRAVAGDFQRCGRLSWRRLPAQRAPASAPSPLPAPLTPASQGGALSFSLCFSLAVLFFFGRCPDGKFPPSGTFFRVAHQRPAQTSVAGTSAFLAAAPVLAARLPAGAHPRSRLSLWHLRCHLLPPAERCNSARPRLHPALVFWVPRRRPLLLFFSGLPRHVLFLSSTSNAATNTTDTSIPNIPVDWNTPFLLGTR